MKKFSSNTQLIAKSFVQTVFLVLSRLITFAPNFSPLGSFGFFSSNILSFFASILLFDYFIGGTYKGSLFTYAGFLMYWILGRLAKTDKQKLLLLPLSSLLFFLVSNFGVWWYWYDHSLSSLATCYLLAVPFYRNTLLGDVVFGYGYMGVKRLLENDKKNKILNLLEISHA